mmetsp:Transcript_26180/g.68745  ORF Transcript_26180/g.68745 Transcript_26180/m.68745 type:complete len:211 (-) Transcript_26180:2823-3455(-)
MSKQKERETRTKKDVVKMLHDFPIPDAGCGEYIAQVVAPAGNNLHRVRTVDGEEHLCSMPNRFRKNIWIKRGDFLIVSPIQEGDKVRCEIVSVLMHDHIRHLRKQDLWPVGFDRADAVASADGAEAAADAPGADDNDAAAAAAPPSEIAVAGDGEAAPAADDAAAANATASDEEVYESSSEDDFSDLVPNTNRRAFVDDEEEASSEDDDD